MMGDGLRYSSEGHGAGGIVHGVAMLNSGIEEFCWLLLQAF